MKALVLAEKPSVARDIARVLGCHKNISGAIEGERYVVTWGLGHLVTLADPEEYDPKHKEWKMEDLPMMPQPFKLEVIRQTGKQYQAVRAQLHRKDVGQVIIATDAGREGELVARLILKKAGNDKPVKRLWISSVTDKAIREGFAALRDGREYENLYDAAMCRAEADWLVGINATRALTCKYNAQLSCGRVQTPTLAMIAEREKRIRTFVSQTFYEIRALAEGLSLTWRDRAGNSRSFDRERIENILRGLEGKEGRVISVKRSPKKEAPPLLYDLTQLQREANSRFGYSAKETLNIMQRLYENHKVLTYPRTDSRYLSADIVPTLTERLKACAVGPYRVLAGRLSMQTLPKKPAFVNDAKVSDHHAIIPTEQFVQLDHMTVDERRIYDLVVRRFLAAMYPASEYEETAITVSAGGESFFARGNVRINPGWRKVYEQDGGDGPGWPGEGSPDGTDGESPAGIAADGSFGMAPEEGRILKDISRLQEGDVLKGLKFSLTQGKTAPPAHFNEASLLAAMEDPRAYMEVREGAKAKEMAKTLGETGGLGTVATRADIIEKLFSGFLVEKRGKDIFLTSKGKQLLGLVPADLKKPELTADWEMKLSRIARGELSRERFMREIREYAGELTGQIKAGEGTFRHDNLTNTKCPACGKRMLLVKGKNSQMLVCQDRACGYRETISRTTNARCPVCHKRMELRGKGDGQIFVCACGHKEKLAAFEARRKKEGAGVSRRDVARYMEKQKKEAAEPVNNAFAQALAGIRLDGKE